MRRLKVPNRSSPSKVLIHQKDPGGGISFGERMKSLNSSSRDSIWGNHFAKFKTVVAGCFVRLKNS